jgi:hypothetical protein
MLCTFIVGNNIALNVMYIYCGQQHSFECYAHLLWVTLQTTVLNAIFVHACTFIAGNNIVLNVMMYIYCNNIVFNVMYKLLRVTSFKCYDKCTFIQIIVGNITT